MLPGVAGMVTTICSVTLPSSRFQTNILTSIYKKTFVRAPVVEHVAPVVHVELVLLEEALRGWVLGLHPRHELVQLAPLLPHRARHVLRDLVEYED